MTDSRIPSDVLAFLRNEASNDSPAAQTLLLKYAATAGPMTDISPKPDYRAEILTAAWELTGWDTSEVWAPLGALLGGIAKRHARKRIALPAFAQVSICICNQSWPCPDVLAAHAVAKAVTA